MPDTQKAVNKYLFNECISNKKKYYLLSKHVKMFIQCLEHSRKLIYCCSLLCSLTFSLMLTGFLGFFSIEFGEKDCVCSTHFFWHSEEFIIFSLFLCSGLPNLTSFQICGVLTLSYFGYQKIFLYEILYGCGMPSNIIFWVCVCMCVYLLILLKAKVLYGPTPLFAGGKRDYKTTRAVRIVTLAQKRTFRGFQRVKAASCCALLTLKGPCSEAKTFLVEHWALLYPS